MVVSDAAKACSPAWQGRFLDGKSRRRKPPSQQAGRDRPHLCPRIGRSTANQILEQVGVDPDTYVKDLTEAETVKLREAVEALEVEGDLRRSARRTSSGSRRSARIAACGTGAACRRADSAPRPTPAAARARGA